MRTTFIMLAIILAVGFTALHFAYSGKNTLVSSPAPAVSSAAYKPAKPDFEKEIKPILQSRCMPCHFQGGQVYDKLPFDKPETITKVGTKLFTRVKDEKEQRIIREFLAQP